MRTLLIMLFCSLWATGVFAQQVVRVETSLPGEPPIGATVTLAIQGYGGFSGQLTGKLTAYLQTSGQALRYIIRPTTLFCPNPPAPYCYSEVSSDQLTAVVTAVRIANRAPALQQRDTSVCDAHPELNLYATFGPECLNPVPYNLSGFLPIGTAITGRGQVTGYYWNVTQGRYWYVTQDGNRGYLIPPEAA